MTGPSDLLPPGREPRLWLFCLGVLLPVAITAAGVAWTSAKDGPVRLVGDSMPPTSLGTLAGVALLTLALWWLLDRVMHRHRLDVVDAGLHVRTSFYTRHVPLSELRLDQARVVDLDERPEFRTALKTNGYALPGFKSGRFRLRNGERAFVAIAGGRRALWLPTTGKEALLLQPRQPDALLSRLRELADATARR